MTVATPMNPNAKPINCVCFGFWLLSITRIASTVISGVTALIMPAKIEVTLVSAIANKIPGTTFNNMATTSKWPQIFGSFGSSTLRALATMLSKV